MHRIAGLSLLLCLATQVCSHPLGAQTTAASAAVHYTAIFNVEDYTAVSPRVTQADAAFRAAAAWVITHGSGAVLDLGSSRWDVCNDAQGWVLPQAPAHSAGLSIVGSNVQASQLVVQCPIHRVTSPAALVGELSQAFIWQPTVRPAALNSYTMHDFTIDAQGRAEACIDMLGLTFVSTFTNITCNGAAGPDHGIRFGDHRYAADAWSFQTVLSNLETTPGGTQGTGAALHADVVNGTLRLSVIRAGSGYSRATRAFLIGYGAGTQPCHVTPQLSLAFSDQGDGAISAVQQTRPAEGCSGPVWVAIYDPVYPLRFGILLDNWTDSSAYDLQPDAGYEAALWLNSSSDVLVHTHACCGMPVQIRDTGTNTWIGTELDSPAHYGFSFEAAASPTLEGTNFFWNTALPGSSAYYFGPDVKNATITGGNCTNLQDAGGYHQLVFPDGPIDLGAAVPYGVSLYGERPCASWAPGSDLVSRPAGHNLKTTAVPQHFFDYTLTLPAAPAAILPETCVRIEQKLPASASISQVQVTPDGYPGDSFTWDTYLARGPSVFLRVCNRSTAAQSPASRVFYLHGVLK